MRLRAGTFKLQYGAGIALLSLLAPVTCLGQVVFSTGVQEIYDDNIFLESGDAVPIPAEVLADPEFVLTPDIDGKEDDDLITNVYLSATGAPELSRYYQTGLGFKVGGLIFSEADSENRLTLDTGVSLKSTEQLLPAPFSVTVSSALNSGSSRSSVAQGTATRQSETHDATLLVDFGKYAFVSATNFYSSYSLQRHDFLGEFIFGGSDSSERVKERGADYFTNTLNAGLSRDLNPALVLSFDNGLNYQSFTKVESNSLIQRDEGELDRLTYNPAVGVSYKPGEQFQSKVKVGLDLTRLSDQPVARTVSVVNEDGTTSVVTSDPSRTETSLFYSGDLQYLADQSSSITLSLSQSVGTDIDGDRIVGRAVSLNGTRAFGDRLIATVGSQYSQFDNGGSLNSDSTERFDATATLHYVIGQAWGIGVGYNYTDQDASGTDVSGLYGDGDYTSNRVFVSLDTGIVGLTR